MFVLASNHLWKCFSVNAGVWLRIGNKFSEKYFQLTVCFNGFDLEMVWSENFQLIVCLKWKFSLQTISGLTRKEREREREPSLQTELQSNDHKPSSSPTTHTPPVSSIAAPHWSSKDRLQSRSISPLDQTQLPLSLFLLLSIWPDLMNSFF